MCAKPQHNPTANTRIMPTKPKYRILWGMDVRSCICVTLNNITRGIARRLSIIAHSGPGSRRKESAGLRSAKCRLLCGFLGRRHDVALRALMRPASEKRQGTKSRQVGQKRRGGRYGDLMLAPIWNCTRNASTNSPSCLQRVSSGECNSHFVARSERNSEASRTECVRLVETDRDRRGTSASERACRNAQDKSSS
jgi:hypothetical protein